MIKHVKVRVHLVKAFTKYPAGGNPAGVVHDAADLTEEQMLAIAQELGFSESAFVSPSDKADFKVRFFAVKGEVDFCGHATVATFHSLVEQGRIKIDESGGTTVTQETKIGVLPVTCHKDGKIMMTQGDPQFGDVETDRRLIASLLGIGEGDLGELPMQSISTATPKLIIPVRSLTVLNNIQPDLVGITAYIKQYGTKGFYPFTSETPSGKGDFAARFFNPAIGIDEDPATGVAAGPLGCYADKYIFKGSKKRIVVEQGFGMGVGSTIYVDITHKVLVGGYAATYGEKELEV